MDSFSARSTLSSPVRDGRPIKEPGPRRRCTLIPEKTRTGRSSKINLPVPCNSSSRSQTHEMAPENGLHAVSAGGKNPLDRRHQRRRHLLSRTGWKRSTVRFHLPPWPTNAASAAILKTSSRRCRNPTLRRRQPERLATSSLIPGPMVEVKLTRFKYLPLTPLGFALTMASTNAAMFSTN